MRRLLLPLLAVAMTVSPVSAAAGALDRLAFTSGSSIYTISADGSQRVRITPLGWNASAPAWSPGGSTIAFARDVVDNENDQRAQVWTLGADGTSPHALTARPGRGVIESAPAWSPDGRRIAFMRLRFHRDSLDAALVVAASDAGGERVLVRRHERQLALLGSPAWSPDGTTLLYTRTTLDKHAAFRPSIYSVPSAGGSPRLFMRDADGASFSPDGRRVAFASVRDRNGQRCGEDECSYAGEIYVAGAEGTGAVRITKEKGDDEQPAWSPDGERIAFHSDRNFPAGENPELYSIRPDGSCLTWLTNGGAASGEPTWEPGAALSSDPGGCGATARPPLIDATVRTRLPGGAAVWWLGPIAPNGLLLSSADTSGGAVNVAYDDCGSFDPSGCPPDTLDLGNDSICDENPLDRHPGARVLGVRGALALVENVEPGLAETWIYTGGTAISASLLRSGLADLAAQLRPVGATSPPAALPPPALPARLWRRLDQIVAVHLRLHTVKATARALHLRRFQVRYDLAIAQALRRLGPRHIAKC